LATTSGSRPVVSFRPVALQPADGSSPPVLRALTRITAGPSTRTRCGCWIAARNPRCRSGDEGCRGRRISGWPSTPDRQRSLSSPGTDPI
jgi:hypothetical protein